MTARVSPLRPMAFVVIATATLLVATLALIQLDTRNASGAVTLPLIVLVPVVFGAVYWLYRR